MYLAFFQFGVILSSIYIVCGLNVCRSFNNTCYVSWWVSCVCSGWQAGYIPIQVRGPRISSQRLYDGKPCVELLNTHYHVFVRRFGREKENSRTQITMIYLCHEFEFKMHDNSTFLMPAYKIK